MDLLLQIILWVWFLECTTSWRAEKYILVEGMGVRSAEFIMLMVYSASIILSLLFPARGGFAVTAVLIVWFIVQFFCHWYFTIFGASDRKIREYNKCFKNTIRIFPQSDKRVVPDLYHIVLHVLIILNMII